jgi:hypothetical protein
MSQSKGASVPDQALAVPVEPVARLDPSGFDPSRNDPVAYTAGWNDAINICAAIAEKWRDENKAARDKARVRGRNRHSFDGDETQLVMAEQLDGAAIECNAIAGAIRMHEIAMEARQGGDGETRLHPKDESAGPKDIAQGARDHD